jgi:hypothetical protein
MKEAEFKHYKAVNTDKYPLSEKKSGDGIPLLQKGAFNIYAMMPCPLIPRFNREFQDYIEEYNAIHEIPIYSPTLLGVGHDEVEEILKKSEHIDELPDALIATGGHSQLCRNFRQHFIETGLFQPYYPTGFADAMPKQLREISEQYKQGFLALGSWDIVYDLSFGEDGPFPKQLTDLSLPEFTDKISLHSCDDSPSNMTLLQLLKEKGGHEALAGFAGNVKSIKHFSNILKSLGTGKPDTTPFNLIPGPAAAQIPSNKQVALIEVEDGLIPMLITVLVKCDRVSDADTPLAFFYSKPIRKMLGRGSFTFADELDPSRRYAFPDWETLVNTDADESKTQLTAEFNLHYKGYQPNGKGCLA